MTGRSHRGCLLSTALVSLFPATVAGTPPTATFTSLLTLDNSYRLYGSSTEAWSPDGSRLGMRGPDGLYILNLDSLEIGPVQVIQPAPFDFSWSPNGRHIVCRVQTPDQARAGLSTLVTVDTETASSETILENADVQAFRWTNNDTIYYWHAGSGARSAIDPSAPGVNPPPPGSATGSLLVTSADLDSGRRGLSTRRFYPQAQTETPLSGVDWVNVKLFAVRGVFPDGRLLASIHERRISPYSAVTDSTGSVIVVLGSGGDPSNAFHATSLSPDGQFVLGIIESDSGHGVIGSATVMLSHPDGLWRVPVQGAPDSIFPRFSPTSYLVALNALSDGAFHLGAVNVQGP